MEEKKKMNFFKRLKVAIFNLEEYGTFIEEKFSVAIKYMFCIILFTSLIMSLILTVEYTQVIKKGLNYIENEFPDFNFESNKLNVNQYVDAYDEQYDFKLIADTTENLTQEKIEEYKKKLDEHHNSLLVLNDKIIYSEYDEELQYKFSDFSQIFNLEKSNKNDILEQFHAMGGIKAVSTMFMIVITISSIIGNIIDVMLDVILVACVGIIIARLCGIAIKGFVAGSLAIYSLTVPVLCTFIYGLILNFTGFQIKYFSVMYLMIAYVYIIAAILIIKTDLIKQAQELMRIKSVEEQIKDEMEKKKLEEQEEQQKREAQEEENKTKENEKGKEQKPKTELKETGAEPNGSEI